MARSLNKTQLIGHLGSDPDIRETNNGNKVANFTLATGESWIDRNTGKQMEQTEWHRVVVFGKAAEIVESYFRKGNRVYVEGKSRTREWTDDQGIRRWTTEVVVDLSGQIINLEGRRDGESAGDKRAESQYEHYSTTREGSRNEAAPEAPPQDQGYESAGPVQGTSDDDVPF